MRNIQMDTYFMELLGAAFVLFALPVASRSGPHCLLSREEHVPCMYNNKNLIRARSNEYTAHFTRLFARSEIQCNVRPKDQTRTTITDLGTDEMRVLYSPGFITGDQYEKELKVEYKVQCGEDDELAYYEFTYLDLQPKDCEDNGNLRCQDYVEIRGAAGGAAEECGNTSLPTDIQSGNFTIIFRTSDDDITGYGFEMRVICYKPAEAELEGCVDASEFVSGVCAGNDIVPSSPSPMPGETRRAVVDSNPPLATFYVDLFPNTGYPPHLEMRQDLAQFHHRWNRLEQQPIEVDVLHNQTVNYSQNFLILLDLDGNILTRYRVVVLQTFNSDGVVERHVENNRSLHFDGPGLLRIVRRRAFFQLFLYDPRGVVPNEEEEREISTMNTPLLNSIAIMDEPRIQRDVNNPIFNDSDREAVFAALRTADSCNAVLRAQSRATLTYYSQMDPNYVDCLRTFNITCSLDGGMLECTSDSVTIPGRTLCHIDGQIPVTCDPFRDSFQVAEGSSNVTVTTVNCDGQTAVYEVIIQEN